MAAEVTIFSGIEITSLGTIESVWKKFTSGTTPAETARGKPILGNTAATLDLGDIAAGSGYLLYIGAITGNVYVKLGATSGTPGATDSHLYIPEGEYYIVPLNPNATAIAGIRVVTDDASGQIEYLLIGS